MDDLAQKQSNVQRSVEDLNNRLFLLEDKVDTTRIAQQRARPEPPRLPVIRITPSTNSDDYSAAEVTAETERNHPPDESSEITLTADESIAYSPPREHETPVRLYGEGNNLKMERPASRRTAKTSSTKAPKLVAGKTSAPSAPEPVVIAQPEPQPVPESPAREETPVKSVPARVSVSSPPEKSHESSIPSSKPTSSANALTEYNAALEQYRAAQYPGAETQFANFIRQHPKHPYTDNALYWQAEAIYAQNRYQDALIVFRRVVEDFPNENKAPAALLKVGYCYAKLEQPAEARTVLNQVVEIFPKTDIAELASTALAQL